MTPFLAFFERLEVCRPVLGVFSTEFDPILDSQMVTKLVPERQAKVKPLMILSLIDFETEMYVFKRTIRVFVECDMEVHECVTI